MTAYGVPAPDGCPLDLTWILLSELRIPSYQRANKAIPKRVDKMVPKFKLRSAGALVVSYRELTLWIVDGQTRAAAARRIGLDRLPSVVSTDQSEKEEAEQFLELNRDRLAMSALERHHAEAIAEEVRALEIDETLYHNLLIASTSGGRTGFHAVHAIGAFEFVWGLGGQDLLDRTIKIIEAGLEKDSARFRGEVVNGLGYFLAHDSWDATHEKIVKALQQAGGKRLSDLAAHWQSIAGIRAKTGSKAAIHMARAIASVVYRQNGPDWKPKKL